MPLQYYHACLTSSGDYCCPVPGLRGYSKWITREVSLARCEAGYASMLFLDGKRLTLGSYMLDCFRLGSQPIEPSSSPICYREVLYNGGGARAPFEDAFPLKQGDCSRRLLLLASEREVGTSMLSRMLYRRTVMMSNFSRSRYIRLRFRLSFTIFSCFLMVLDLREIFCSNTYIILIWQRAKECIFLRSFLALPGTLGAFRFWTNFSVET